MLENIIEKAIKAPTCGNMQLYTIIATQDVETLKSLKHLHYNQPAANAPLILTICADFYRFSKWCRLNNATTGYNNLHSFIMAITDAVIVAQQITTIAEQEGLGTCYLGTVTYNADEISKLLELPELTVPVASLAIGYPQTQGQDTLRLPLKGILHKEKYHKFSEEEIFSIYKEQEENAIKSNFIGENGKNNLAQVISEVKYPKDLMESLSQSIEILLKEKGFL